MWIALGASSENLEWWLLVIFMLRQFFDGPYAEHTINLSYIGQYDREEK